MAEKKELEIKEEQALTPYGLLAKAMELNVTPEVIEKMMNLQDRHEAKQAKKAFDEAMAKFQAECPIIEKTKTVKNGGGATLYSYAPLEKIVSQLKETIQRNGFSYTFKTEFPDGVVRAICVVKHVAGHAEESGVEIPLMAKTGIMNNSQQTAATITFAKRYAFMDAFGIATSDEDNDANKIQKEEKTDQEKLETAEEMLQSCTTLKELQSKWTFLTANYPAEAKKLEKVKDELKTKLG